MPKTIRCALLVVLLFSLGVRGMCAADPSGELTNFFRGFIGLNDDQIQAIREGKAVAKVLNSPTPNEVFVFGSVYIESTPEHYLALASDVDALRRLPSYLAIQKFSDPPQLADLAGFTLADDDVKDLQQCKPGHCDVQLPSDAIQTFQHSINWSAPDRTNQVNRLTQQMALQALQQYMEGGNATLGTYRDKSHPTAVAETFASLLGQMKPVPVYLPELDDYLLGYPKAPSKRHRIAVLLGESEFRFETNASYRSGGRLQGHVSRQARLCCGRETALCQPLFRNCAGPDRLREEPGHHKEWFLPDYDQGVAAGGPHWLQGQHGEKGGG